MKPGMIAKVVEQELLSYSPRVGSLVKLISRHKVVHFAPRWKVQILNTVNSNHFLPSNITYVDERKLEVVNPKLMKALYG